MESSTPNPATVTCGYVILPNDLIRQALAAYPVAVGLPNVRACSLCSGGPCCDHLSTRFELKGSFVLPNGHIQLQAELTQPWACTVKPEARIVNQNIGCMDALSGDRTYSGYPVYCHCPPEVGVTHNISTHSPYQYQVEAGPFGSSQVPCSSRVEPFNPCPAPCNYQVGLFNDKLLQISSCQGALNLEAGPTNMVVNHCNPDFRPINSEVGIFNPNEAATSCTEDGPSNIELGIVDPRVDSNKLEDITLDPELGRSTAEVGHSNTDDGGPNSKDTTSPAAYDPKKRHHIRSNRLKRCTFCYSNNREMPEIYIGHVVKRFGITVCPILRNYVCRICNGTGDNGHTENYCPERKQAGRNKTNVGDV